MIALFDRAEARDSSASTPWRPATAPIVSCELAAAVDGGFDELVFAAMLDSLGLHRR